MRAFLPGPARADDSFALKATTQTRFAYVVTGDSEVDDISRAGLDGLYDLAPEEYWWLP